MVQLTPTLLLLGAASYVSATATTVFPSAAGTTAFPTAVLVSGTFDGKMLRYERNPDVCQGQTETLEPDAMFILEPGATIQNAIIGRTQAEGIHCRGPCTIKNVWWERVCEDAATFKQPNDTDVSNVIGGGAKTAADKIFQFNGRGTLNVKDFFASSYGKVVRSCGDCTKNGGPRIINIDGVIARSGGVLCGINTNFGDKCKITNSCTNGKKICQLYLGAVKGQKPTGTGPTGMGPDGTFCTTSNFTQGPNC